MKKYILFSLFILSPVSIYATCDCLQSPATSCGSAANGGATTIWLSGDSWAECLAYVGNCNGQALVNSCAYLPATR